MMDGFIAFLLLLALAGGYVLVVGACAYVVIQFCLAVLSTLFIAPDEEEEYAPDEPEA